MTRNIQATDAQGNKVSEPVQINGVDPTSSGGGGGAFEDTDGDSVAELQDSHADFQGGDARTIGALDTATIDVTNEALVETVVTTDQSISSNTWTTVDFDKENTDVTGSYALSTNEFVPPEDGYYQLTCNCRFSGGTNTDASIELRLRNTTDTTDVRHMRQTVGSSADVSAILDCFVYLYSSKTYEIQAKNPSSSDVIEGTAGTSSWLAIQRVVLG